MMELSSTAVLDRLYDAFSDGPRPVSIDACPCCVNTDTLCRLTSTPLRKISPGDLKGYAASVFLTAGSEADFRYFLPRILELLVTINDWWPHPEVVGRAMANIPWDGYTTSQQQALTAYFDAVFESLLSSAAPDGYEIDSWLCCSSSTVPDWEQILDEIIKVPAALVALYEWHAEPLQKRRLGNGFWDNSPKSETFLNWLLSEEVKTVLWKTWGLA